MKLSPKDQPIVTDLDRSGVGLRVNVRVHPVIEEFMQNVLGGSPRIDDVEAFGRQWEPARGETRKELRVYAIPKELTGEFHISGGVSYRLDRPGQPLLLPGGGLDRGTGMTSANCLNLSFLRLVGISQPGGVTFHIGGIFGEDVLDTLERAIGLATKEVYSQFMKPIKLTIALEVSEPSVERERTIEVQAPEVVDGTAPASGVAA